MIEAKYSWGQVMSICNSDISILAFQDFETGIFCCLK